MNSVANFKTPTGEGEEAELLVPARVLQVFTDLMFTQQGRVQDGIIRELQSIQERVQLVRDRNVIIFTNDTLSLLLKR